MKKTMIILVSVALVLILLVVGLLWYLIARLPKLKNADQPDDLETYLTEKWSFYRLRSWDEDSGALVLEYPQRLTYEQFRKYGAELDLAADALAQREHLEALCIGVAGRLKQQVKTVTLIGISSDGEEVYTVDLTGSLTTCWEP